MQSDTTVHEIADSAYRIATPVRFPGGAEFSFNQYLVVDELPLLFHTGLRRRVGVGHRRRGAGPARGRGILTGADGGPLFPATTAQMRGAPLAFLAGNPAGHAQALADVAAGCALAP